VGTHEFVDFCRRAGAEPFYCISFLSNGEKRYGDRAGDAREAADWVSYANDPDHRERRANGFRADLVVEGRIIVEVKSAELVAPMHKKQLDY